MALFSLRRSSNDSKNGTNLSMPILPKAATAPPQKTAGPTKGLWTTGLFLFKTRKCLVGNSLIMTGSTVSAIFWVSDYTASWWFYPSLKYKSTWIISQTRAEKKMFETTNYIDYLLSYWAPNQLYLTWRVVSYRRRSHFPPPLHQPGNSSEDQAWCPSEIDLQGRSWPVVGDVVDPT